VGEIEINTSAWSGSRVLK